MTPKQPIIKRTEEPDVEGHGFRRHLQDEELQAPDPESDDPAAGEALTGSRDEVPEVEGNALRKH